MKKYINICTIVLIILAIITFEIGYCNREFMTNVMNNVDANYNFSFCRIVMYFTTILLYFIFRKHFIEDAKDTLNSKYKKIIIILVVALLFILLISVTTLLLRDKIFFRKGVLFILTTIMGCLYAIYASNNVIKNTILALATFGIVFSVTTDINHIADEKKHFITAYNISILNFNYFNNPLTDEKIEKIPNMLTYDNIDEFLRETYKSDVKKSIDIEDIYNTPTSYLPALYIPPAIGIATATFLSGSIIDVYICGRIFNLIFYGILVCIALKLLPYKKRLFSLVFLMPMLIMYAASYSIDGICVGLVSIFIAYCLNLYDRKENIKVKDIVILIVLFVVMLFAKSMAYIAVSLIVFILPLKNIIKNNKKIIPILIITTVILLIIGLFVVNKIIKMQFSTDIRESQMANSNNQVEFILKNPTSIITIIINHIKNTILNYKWVEGLHHYTFFSDSSKYLFFPMFLFILLVSIWEDEYNFALRQKVLFIITFLLTFLTTSIPLYIAFTPVGQLSIYGYQTRYILPILSLILICISNNKIKSKEIINKTNHISITMGLFILIGLYQLIN